MTLLNVVTTKAELVEANQVSRVALIGMGSVGLGWAATYLAKGHTVLAHDPDPKAQDRAHAFLEQAWLALRELDWTTLPNAPFDKIQYVGVHDAVQAAQVIHENAPEHLKIKQEIIRAIEASADPSCVICSSSGGLPPTKIQEGMNHPERFVIAHPFNPPHLMPLVEVIGGHQTDAAVVAWVLQLMKALGKKPIQLDREKTAYLTNRLQFALLREAVNCLDEGVASAESIDDAVKYALAPRWATSGSLMTLALAGGLGGMTHTLEQFAPAIELWWNDLGAPKLTPGVKQKMIEAADQIAKGRSMTDLVNQRDEKLIRLLKVIEED